tara:strand:- start:318 stop:887 length:570 start_codon:yes stop_codon:yes gene_type:complete
MALTRIGLNQSINLASNVTGTLPAANGGTGATSFAPGKVLQVVSTNVTSAVSITVGDSATLTNITGMSVTITPSSTSSKIFVTAQVVFTLNDNTYGTLGGLCIQRGTTKLNAGGDNVSGTTVVGQNESSVYGFCTIPLQFLDSPSTTSATTYNVGCRNMIGGDKTGYLNGAKNGSNKGSSVITAYEIGA